MNQNLTISCENLFQAVKEIASREDFLTYVNNKLFEEEVTNLVKDLQFDKQSEQIILQKLEELLDKNNNQAFILFFILLTKYRRNKIGNLKEFVDKYLDYFGNIKFSEFIPLLCQFTEENDEKSLLRLLKRTDKLINSKGENYDFTTHLGILNLYVEIVCKYFESQLDERFDEDMVIYLKKASEVVDDMIRRCGENVYIKYFLNKGRIMVLLGKYKEGENFINRAIKLVPIGPERENTIREYQQYLIKVSVVKTYDTTANKIKELDSVKVNNTKTLALMTSLLGFLLGSINIFSSVTDVFTLAMLMLGYISLLLVLTGIVLLGLNLTFNEKRKKFIIYDIAILLLGISLFITTMIIILGR